jgi:hypothetical protein
LLVEAAHVAVQHVSVNGFPASLGCRDYAECAEKIPGELLIGVTICAVFSAVLSVPCG